MLYFLQSQGLEQCKAKQTTQLYNSNNNTETLNIYPNEWSYPLPALAPVSVLWEIPTYFKQQYVIKDKSKVVPGTLKALFLTLLY